MNPEHADEMTGYTGGGYGRARVPVLAALVAAAVVSAACGGGAASDAVTSTDANETSAVTEASNTGVGARTGTTATGTSPTGSPTVNGSTADAPRQTSTRAAEAGRVESAPPVPVTVTLPEGTELHLRLTDALASDTSRVEDVVKATLTRAVAIDGRTVVPAGAAVTGLVTAADASARVKGRAMLSVEFTRLQTGGTLYEMRTSGYSQTAAATKSEDATKIGVGAGIGAAVGGLLGGGKGAAQGAAIGGGAGTGVVLATRGQEVRLEAGTDVTTRLTGALAVRVPN